MLANHVFWRLTPFCTPLLLFLQPLVQWLSIVTLIMMQSHCQSVFCANWKYYESDHGQAGYPTLKRLHGKI